jgi:hypothetical protein
VASMHGNMQTGLGKSSEKARAVSPAPLLLHACISFKGMLTGAKPGFLFSSVSSTCCQPTRGVLELPSLPTSFLHQALFLRYMAHRLTGACIADPEIDMLLRCLCVGMLWGCPKWFPSCSRSCVGGFGGPSATLQLFARAGVIRITKGAGYFSVPV